MGSENRKFTLLSFVILSGLIGYILYLILTQISDWMKFGGSNVIAGLPWMVVGGGIASLLGLILFIVLVTNQTALDFTDDVFAELKKTTWPNTQETTRSTIAVSVMVGVAAFILFLIDALWHFVFQVILS